MTKDASPSYNSIRLLPRRNPTKLIKRLLQLRRDVRCLPMLNITALDHMNQLSIAKQRNRRRRRRIPRKIAASAVGGIFVLSGENREQLLWARGILQRDANRRPHAPRRASANRIHDHHRGSRLVDNGAIDFLGGAQLLNPHAG